jgi:CMP/dCMP kinase
MPLRITIAGDIGSGKTTVARRLAGMIGVEPLSIGSIQRQLAQARGVSTLELNQLAETDTTIDREIDSYQMNLPPGNVVAEARLAWHFIADTLKVYLYISDYEAARRIVRAKRSDETYESSDPLESIIARRRSEASRFQKYYGVDIDDLNNYDLVIDTTQASIDEVVRKVYKRARHIHNEREIWISPQSLVPTQGIRDLSSDSVDQVEGEIIAHGYETLHDVSALYVDHVFYILDGHARVAAAIRNKLTFVPVRIVASDDQPYVKELSARQYIQDAVNDSRVNDWEDAVGFKFRDRIWQPRSKVA